MGPFFHDFHFVVYVLSNSMIRSPYQCICPLPCSTSSCLFFVAKNNVHIEIISYHRRKHKCSVLFSVYRLLFNSYPIYPLHCILLIFQCVYEKDFSIYRFNFSSILELTRKDQRMQRDLMYHGIVWLLSRVVGYLFDFKCKSIER